MAVETLTAAQRSAVEHPGGPILVSAAAGSGKTKVLVERLMHRVCSTTEDCNINDFLIITFTKKAASELRERIARELALRLSEQPDNAHLLAQQNRVYLAQISTIHAFCAELLREFSHPLGLDPDFRVMEEAEAAALQEKLVDRVLEARYSEIGTDEALQLLIDSLGAGRTDRSVAALVLRVYQSAQCRIYPAAWLDACAKKLELNGVEGAEQTVWGRFLLDRLGEELSIQADVLQDCLVAIGRIDGLASYVGPFAQTLGKLRELAGLTTWDQVYEAVSGGVDFGNLKGTRVKKDVEMHDEVQAARSKAIKRIQDRLSDFYGDSAQVLADLRQTGRALNALFSLTKDFSAAYQTEKRRLRALDFNDLEHKAVELLLMDDGRTPTPLAAELSARYTEILVDEYQDTNEVQDCLFRAISRDGRNRFMVGDVKQSIYRFRLADPAIFLEKYERYPDAETVAPDARQRILLSKNFRSGEPILEAANAVFRRCMTPRVGGLHYSDEEALTPGRPHVPLDGPQVELHCLSAKVPKTDEEAESRNENELEATFAARRIQRLLDERTPVRDGEAIRPVTPGDIVILHRAPKNDAALYLDALRLLGIPAVSDSGESILDSRELETLMDLLQVLDNAHQDVPLSGALLSPLFDVRPDDLALARKSQPGLDLCDALEASAEENSRLRAALDALRRLRADARDLPLHQLLEQVNRETGMEAVFAALPGGEARRANLRRFAELASSFSENGKKSLHQFLDYLDTLKQKGVVPARVGGENAVTVMSIHKAKGLEFPVVLLCGLSHPISREDLKQQVQFQKELGAGCNVYDPETHTRFPSIAKEAINRRLWEENVSEELRVLYVAMTRPKDRLIMTYCGRSVDTRLAALASRLRPETASLLAREATCMGDWVLLTALLRTEAGELHAVGGRPEGTQVSDLPWTIRYHRLYNETRTAALRETQTVSAPAPDPAALTRSLDFRYPHPAAVTVPSKLTATQIKGRLLDEEAADGQPVRSPWRGRKLSLLSEEKPLTPAQRGTAMHQAMQYLDFSQTDTLDQIQGELERIVREQRMERRQIETVDPARLLAVFRGPLGERIRAAEEVIREFKFSLLVDAGTYASGAAGEKLMLQGVVDLCLRRDGALTVVDFKTDHVRPGEERAAGERYRAQLGAYSTALARIFGLPVREKLLYFFATDTLVPYE